MDTKARLEKARAEFEAQAKRFAECRSFSDFELMKIATKRLWEASEAEMMENNEKSWDVNSVEAQVKAEKEMFRNRGVPYKD